MPDFNKQQKLSPDLPDSVARAVAQAEKLESRPETPRISQGKQSFHWQILWLLLLLVIGAVYFISGHAAFGIPTEYAPLANHVSLALLLSGTILVGHKTIDSIIIRRLHDSNVRLLPLVPVTPPIVART